MSKEIKVCIRELRQFSNFWTLKILEIETCFVNPKIYSKLKILYLSLEDIIICKMKNELVMKKCEAKYLTVKYGSL